MNYVVRITENNHSDYIAEGRTYQVNGSLYVPLTSRIDEAKKYKSIKSAERASRRSGENIRGTIDIVKVN